MKGSKIKNSRKAAGITLAKLSELSGVSKGYLCDIENDKTNPSVKIIEKIASILKIGISDLIETKENDPDSDLEWAIFKIAVGLDATVENILDLLFGTNFDLDKKLELEESFSYWD